jgi:hypothetical protein
VPGFDKGGANKDNACKKHDKDETALHQPQVCSGWMIGSDNPKDNCKCDEIKSLTLRNGCKNFLKLGWHEPSVQYEELEKCPPELISTPPCWKDNKKKWPTEATKTCKRPTFKLKSNDSKNETINL